VRQTSTAPALLKERDIPEASIAVRKPVVLDNVCPFLWLQWKSEHGPITVFEVNDPLWL